MTVSHARTSSWLLTLCLVACGGGSGDAGPNGSGDLGTHDGALVRPDAAGGPDIDGGAEAVDGGLTDGGPNDGAPNDAGAVDGASPGRVCPSPAISGETRAWTDDFAGSWPDRLDTRQLTFASGTYVAYRVDPSQAIDRAVEDGTFENFFVTAFQTARVLTLSECLGDFDTSALPAGCVRRETLTTQLRWSIGESDRRGVCELDPTKTYYLNLAFDDGSLGECGDARTCRTYLKHQ